MTAALFTGSRVYGTPKKSSDLDLVLLVSEAEFDLLRRISEDHGYFGGSQYDVGDGRSASLQFGKLNVIATTSAVAFAVFEKSTKELKKIKPVSRDEAVKHMVENRQKFGLDYTSRDVKTSYRKERIGKKSRGDEDDEIPF